MRVLHLYAENVLNLRAVAITPNGRVTRITGKNGAGKSNVLNAMFYALAGKKGHATKPIRRGEERATVRVDLGDEEIALSVILRITEKGAYIDVESPEGARFKSPQAMLDALIGQLTFDPQAFSRMEADDRLETLRQLVTPGIDLDALDRQNQADYQLRADWNRKLRSLTERATALRADIDVGVPTEPVDVSPLTQQMAQAAEHNANVREQARVLGQMRAEIENRDAENGELLEQIAELEQRISTNEANNERARRIIEGTTLLEPTDVASLREQIDAAANENRVRDFQRRLSEDLGRVERDLEESRAASASLTQRMDDRELAKAKAIGAVKMPINGLGFGDGDVTFNGLPFDQASTGEQLRIATAIGMALNPKLRVLCVRDGSLLDSDSLAILEQMAEAHDYQLWIEATQESPTVGVHIVDGSVAAVDGVAVGEETLAEVGD